MKFIFAYVFLIFLSLTLLDAQVTYPSLSPEGRVYQVVGETQVSLRYERPQVRGRVIFGGLVPWGEVWRTGAGYCTVIRFDQPVMVGKQRVPAGAYSLFTVPHPDKWRVMLNTDTTLYGAYDHDPAKDIARFEVPATETGRFYETLTIDIDLRGNDAMLFISWANVQVAFPIETGLDEEIRDYIFEKLMANDAADAEAYAEAASYLLSQGYALYDALALTQRALAADPESEFVYNVLVQVYEALGSQDKALETAQRALELVKGKTYTSEADRAGTIGWWEEIVERLEE